MLGLVARHAISAGAYLDIHTSKYTWNCDWNYRKRNWNWTSDCSFYFFLGNIAIGIAVGAKVWKCIRTLCGDFLQVYDMMDVVQEHLYEVDTTAVEEDIINVAIVGRPNVGK